MNSINILCVENVHVSECFRHSEGGKVWTRGFFDFAASFNCNGVEFDIRQKSIPFSFVGIGSKSEDEIEYMITSKLME